MAVSKIPQAVGLTQLLTLRGFPTASIALLPPTTSHPVERVPLPSGSPSSWSRRKTLESRGAAEVTSLGIHLMETDKGSTILADTIVTVPSYPLPANDRDATPPPPDLRGRRCTPDPPIIERSSTTRLGRRCLLGLGKRISYICERAGPCAHERDQVSETNYLLKLPPEPRVPDHCCCHGGRHNPDSEHQPESTVDHDRVGGIRVHILCKDNRGRSGNQAMQPTGHTQRLAPPARPDERRYTCTALQWGGVGLCVVQ